MTKFEEHEPKTLDEAINILVGNLDEAEKEFIRTNDDAGLHHGFGTHMRNGWNLWDTKNPINQDIQKRFKLFGHGDDCSGLIFTGLWAKVRGEDVEAALNREAEYYRRHWKKSGLDPATGKALGGEVKQVHMEVVMCRSCKQIIDPDVCHCGEDPKAFVHHAPDGHHFVPMGCDCGRSK